MPRGKDAQSAGLLRGVPMSDGQGDNGGGSEAEGIGTASELASGVGKTVGGVADAADGNVAGAVGGCWLQESANRRSSRVGSTYPYKF